MAFHPSKCYIASAGADALAKVFVWQRASISTLALYIFNQLHKREEVGMNLLILPYNSENVCKCLVFAGCCFLNWSLFWFLWAQLVLRAWKLSVSNSSKKKKKRRFYFRGCEFSSRQALGETRSMYSLLIKWSTGKKGFNCFREREKRETFWDASHWGIVMCLKIKSPGKSVSSRAHYCVLWEALCHPFGITKQIVQREVADA